MPALIEERVVERYRLGAEALRDLDAILRQRCQEMDPDLSLTYEVRRADGLVYSTADVEEVLRERNGPETAITSLSASAKKEGVLELAVTFARDMRLALRGDDRARIALLASDVRALAREGLAARPQRFANSSRFLIVYAAVMLSLFGYVAYDSWADARADKKRDAEVAQYEARRDQLRAEQLGRTMSSVRRTLDLGAKARASPDDRTKLDFLISERMGEAQESLDSQALNDLEYPSLESGARYGFVLIYAVPIATGAATYLALRLLWPSTPSSFLIGIQVDREREREARRQRWLWGVAVALVVGVIGSVIASAITS